MFNPPFLSFFCQKKCQLILRRQGLPRMIGPYEFVSKRTCAGCQSQMTIPIPARHSSAVRIWSLGNLLEVAGECCKGQLNSEWIYEVIVSPTIQTQNYKDFCPTIQTRIVALFFLGDFLGECRQFFYPCFFGRVEIFVILGKTIAS